MLGIDDELAEGIVRVKARALRLSSLEIFTVVPLWLDQPTTYPQKALFVSRVSLGRLYLSLGKTYSGLCETSVVESVYHLQTPASPDNLQTLQRRILGSRSSPSEASTEYPPRPEMFS